MDQEPENFSLSDSEIHNILLSALEDGLKDLSFDEKERIVGVVQEALLESMQLGKSVDAAMKEIRFKYPELFPSQPEDVYSWRRPGFKPGSPDAGGFEWK